jgi:hypothetical protein
VYPGGIEYPEDAVMDDETMQLLKVLREQLGKTSASRSVDALAAANSLGLERAPSSSTVAYTIWSEPNT